MTLCPVCEDRSTVAPVSDVYAESSAGGGTGDLAWLLAPPRVEPRLPAHSYQDREENRILLPVIGLLVIIGLGAAIDGYGFGGFLVVTLPGGLVGLMVAKGDASARYQAARAAAIAAAAAQEKLPAHQQLVERWLTALSCHRDDIVFFLDGEAPLRPIEFRNLITGYRPPPAPAPAPPPGN